MQQENKKTTFASLGVHESILTQLQKLGFTDPTPIQSKAIPIALKGDDVLGVAQTGTGKTLAFSIPMIEQLHKTKGVGLILLPTRELALQVDQELQKIGRGIGLKTAVVIGGASMHMQKKQLRGKTHVIIATPGRLADHVQQKSVNLSKVRVLVLDEADRMLDMGFEPQIKQILEVVPEKRQTMLFSATMPTQILNIANSYMKTPLHVEVAPAGTAAALIDQEAFIVKKEDRLQLLDQLLKEYRGSVLVFSRTKHGAKKLAIALRKMGYKSAEIHSNRSLGQRKEALKGFKKGRFQVLVATDIAARGIDVKEIELVVNYDLPDQKEDYVHRIGRTGRGGSKGKAISFVLPNQKRELKQIERLMKKDIPKTWLEGSPQEEEKQPKKRSPRKRPPSRGHRRQKPRRSGYGSARPKRKSRSRSRR